MRKIKKSGIILITTLIFMTLTFMLAVMICKNGKESLLAGNRYADNEQAYLAAVSGIEFIKGQLYRDKSWGAYVTSSNDSSNKNYSNEHELTNSITEKLINEPTNENELDKLTTKLNIEPKNRATASKYNESSNLLIERANNKITGYILLDDSKEKVSNNNYNAKFEIFFVNNSAKKEYKSINNLNNSVDILMTDEANGGKRDVPAKSFYAYVKGTCGKTIRYAEALLVSGGPKSLDGGSVINGTVKINNLTATDTKEYSPTNPFITIQNVNTNKNGKITANNSLTFINDKTSDPSIILNNSTKTIISSNGIKIGTFTGTTVDSTETINKSHHIQYDPMPQIRNEIQNYSDSTNNNDNAELLESGTYIFINDLNDPTKCKWVYTPYLIESVNTDTIDIIKKATPLSNIDSAINYQNIEFVKVTNESNTNSSGKTQETRTVKIKGKISSSALNFIVVDKIVTENANDKTNHALYRTSNSNTIDFSMQQNSIITTSGNIYINGEVTGEGKIFCGGNLTMNAGSQLETKPQSGVAIYADGNVNIKEAKNLSSDSSDMENQIIEEAIQEARDNNITTVSKTQTYNTSDFIDGGSTTEDFSTQTNGDGFYDNRGNFINTNNITSQTDSSIQVLSFSRNAQYWGWIQTGRHWWEGHEGWKDFEPPISISYQIKMEKNTISIYKEGEKEFYFHINEDSEECNFYQNTQVVSFAYHRTAPGPHENSPENPGGGPNHDDYDYDYELYIDGRSIGILDLASACGTTPKSYNSFKNNNILNVEGGKFIFSRKDYKDKSMTNNQFKDFQYIATVPVNQVVNIKSDDAPDTIQGYVEEYYNKKVSNTEIKGSIYSKNGNITIDGNNGKFNITGALITANVGNDGGNLTMNNISHVNLIYDPQYVPFFSDEGIFTTSIFESVF